MSDSSTYRQALRDISGLGWLMLGLGLLSTVAGITGITIVSSPNIGAATLALLVGVALIANDVSFSALGLVFHSTGRDSPAPLRQAPAAAV